MNRFLVIMLLAVCGSSRLAVGDDGASRFAGEWKTSFGIVKLEPAVDGSVKGKITSQTTVEFQGKLAGSTLSFGYKEGSIQVDATWNFEPNGNAFAGTFRASNGNQGVWSGWRPDPKASSGQPAKLGGLWLTDLGLMELNLDGSKVKGRYALRGTTGLEGELKGRHLDFTIQGMWTGPGWFDVDDAGTTLTGAGGTDGMPAWYGWKGRKADEYIRHVPLVAGKIVDGSTENLLTYSVRAPDGFRAGDGKKWPAILILHGSNMNSQAYVNTIATAWPDIARDYLLLGINGEIPSNIAQDGPVFNYSYINFMGRSTFGGYPGTDRESPGLVSEALDDLKAVYPIKSYFVGGHSQGGFLTYSLLMNYPEKIAGAFPISAGLMFQCEPSAFVNVALRTSQRNVPLAIVHSKADPFVPFDGATYASGLFLDAGWPAARLFTNDTAGHMFALLPVNQAIRWLETLNSDDPATLVEFADRRLREHAPRDAGAAIRRARTLKLDDPLQARLDDLTGQLNKLAAPGAETYLAAIKADRDNTWIDGFLAYRDDFELAEAAGPALAAFEVLRRKHNPDAKKAMGEARGAFNQGRRDDGYAKAQEVVDHYYASTSYRLAKKWAAEQAKK